MKKILLVLFAVVGLFTFADDDPEYAYVDVPYTCIVDKSQKAVTVTFADGSIRNFYYCSFNNTHSKVTDAMSGFGNAYNTVVRAMSDGGIAEKFYSENMVRWVQVVQSILYIGQAKQQDIEYVLQEEFQEQYKDGLISEETFNTKISESNAKISTLESNYDAAFSGVYSKMATSMSSLEQQLTALNETQAQQMQELANKVAQIQGGGSSSGIAEAMAAVQKSSLEIAALKKSLSDLKTTVSKKNMPIIATGDMSRSTFSTNINDVSRWLGSHKNLNIFTPPVYPYDGTQYTNGENIATWMNHIGVVGYLDAGLSEAWGYETGDYENISNMYFNSYCFYEVPYETVTNVAATFQAPTNWADNVTIICTNGVYTANAVTTIQTEHNGATASLREDEIEVPVNADAAGNRLIFRTADDSDVRINVSTNATGDIILTFGVYWK